MYRNSIEKNLQRRTDEQLTNLEAVVVHKGLLKYANKCNYREYIKKRVTTFKAHKKVLPRDIFIKGVGKCEKVLCLSFETWLYFFYSLKHSKALFYGSYAPIWCLVIFLRKLVIK